MAKGTVVIGCKLPNGIVLHHPLNSKLTVTIKGLNDPDRIIGATYVTTQVDAEFWEAWKLLHQNYQPLKSNALFEASGVREAEDKGKELAAERTGFEPMSKDAPAPGIKPEKK